MKSWWWKLTVTWPAALGDWLWALLVVGTAGLLDKLTFKQLVWGATMGLLIYGFAHVFAFELAVVFAADMVVYLELLGAVMLAAGRGYARAAVQTARHMIRANVRVACGDCCGFVPGNGATQML